MPSDVFGVPDVSEIFIAIFSEWLLKCGVFTNLTLIYVLSQCK